MIDTERLEAYHNGYDQGRFDEYADRVGRKQAEKVQVKILKQQYCPYCHSEKPLMKTNDDDIVIYIANSLDSEPLTLIYDFSSMAITDEEFMIAPFGRRVRSINFCPMCGRPLNEGANDEND